MDETLRMRGAGRRTRIGPPAFGVLALARSPRRACGKGTPRSSGATWTRPPRGTPRRWSGPTTRGRSRSTAPPCPSPGCVPRRGARLPPGSRRPRLPAGAAGEGVVQRRHVPGPPGRGRRRLPVGGRPLRALPRVGRGRRGLEGRRPAQPRTGQAALGRRPEEVGQAVEGGCRAAGGRGPRADAETDRDRDRARAAGRRAGHDAGRAGRETAARPGDAGRHGIGRGPTRYRPTDARRGTPADAVGPRSAAGLEPGRHSRVPATARPSGSRRTAGGAAVAVRPRPAGGAGLVRATAAKGRCRDIQPPRRAGRRQPPEPGGRGRAEVAVVLLSMIRLRRVGSGG